jgi:hypothetical protein
MPILIQHCDIVPVRTLARFVAVHLRTDVSLATSFLAMQQRFDGFDLCVPAIDQLVLSFK